MIALRKMTEKDLPFLLEVRNDESTRKWLANNDIFTLEQAQEWFKNLKSVWYVVYIPINTSSWLSWLIFWGSLYFDIGKVGYIRTSDETDTRITIGCDIHPKGRRKGCGTTALLKVIEMYKNKEIYLWVFLKNKIAVRLYLKLGFNFTGNFTRVREELYMEMKLEKPEVRSRETSGFKLQTFN